MSEMRCDRCKHWDENEVKQMGDGSGELKIGLCTRAMPFWNATTWHDEDDGYHRVLLPECADRKFFAQDGSDYRADVYTTPDFFCAEFSEKTEGTKNVDT